MLRKDNIQRPPPQIRRKSFIQPRRRDSEVVNLWSNFINGNGAKPKEQLVNRKYPATLISCTNSEPARNKPVVGGFCEGMKATVFLDSGAEMNVVDHEYWSGLQKTDNNIKLIPSVSQIKCANGITMNVMGYTHLRLEIGSVKVTQRFTVVKNMFPKILVGIRTMKTMNIVLHPNDNCVYVGNGVPVPFLSIIEPQSTSSSENGQGPTSGVGGGRSATRLQ